MPEQGAELSGFLEAAGRSLAEAQGELAGLAADVPTTVAIAEAELELKAAVARRADGTVVLETISTGDMRAGGITPGLLSTVRIQYVAVGTAATLGAEAPRRTPEDVVGDVKGRDDVGRLDRILGGLVYEAQFVPGPKRWLVTARDADARIVREVLVPDEGA